MSVPILEVYRKRRKAPKVYNFHTFCAPGCPTSLVGSFRENVREFLKQCAEPLEYEVEEKPVWCTLLLVEGQNYVVPLYTIEEDMKKSPQPFCDHCRCVGWSGNFVSTRKYHIIIPTDGEWSKPLHEGILDLHSHLLHGLVHCNGHGHLICINGIEGGSKCLCGREIMDLWDRICTNLRSRKISVEDVSQKRTMDVRLLYGVAYGHSWFGRWGYKFCRGSFGVTESNYESANEILGSLQLNTIVRDFSSTNQSKYMKQIICFYTDLSGTKLMTLQDILRFMLTLKSYPSTEKKRSNAAGSASTSSSKVSVRLSLPHKTVVKEKMRNCRRLSALVGTLDSRWSQKRLEYAAGVIVDALKEKKEDSYSHAGMTRQDVRDAARMHIGDTGLLDYVLKSMNNVIVGSHIVRRVVNPKTRILEYSIEELYDGNDPSHDSTTSEAKALSELLQAPSPVPGADIYNDISYLYENILFDYPGSELIRLAAQTVVDSKHFVKKWPINAETEQALTIICQVLPGLIDLEAAQSRNLTPGEVVMLPLHATVAELKYAAENALRDTYCVLERFVVTDIEGMEGMQDHDQLFGVVHSGSQVFLRGYGMDLETQLRFEGGIDNWKVRCECGAQDDDGERMIACDICEVWQHTRCNEIEDSQNVPLLFVCSGCRGLLEPSRREPCLDFESTTNMLNLPEYQFGAEVSY